MKCVKNDGYRIFEAKELFKQFTSNKKHLLQGNIEFPIIIRILLIFSKYTGVIMVKSFSRREFLHSTFAFAGTLYLYKTLDASVRPDSSCCYTPKIEYESVSLSENSLLIDLTTAKSLEKLGSTASYSNEDRSIHLIIVHDKDNFYHVCSKFCTHGGHQPVSYIPKRNLLQCNGYNHSLFTLQGKIRKGPAPEPLRSYPVRQYEHMLEIDLS